MDDMDTNDPEFQQAVLDNCPDLLPAFVLLPNGTGHALEFASRFIVQELYAGTEYTTAVLIDSSLKLFENGPISDCTLVLDRDRYTGVTMTANELWLLPNHPYKYLVRMTWDMDTMNDQDPNAPEFQQAVLDNCPGSLLAAAIRWQRLRDEMWAEFQQSRLYRAIERALLWLDRGMVA
jgi:hypothetical protein